MYRSHGRPMICAPYFHRMNAAATVGGLIGAPAILGTKSAAASPGDEIRVGLIGCGGRGGEAAMNELWFDD